MLWYYEGFDATGEPKRGDVEAETLEGAASALRSKGIFAQNLTDVEGFKTVLEHRSEEKEPLITEGEDDAPPEDPVLEDLEALPPGEDADEDEAPTKRDLPPVGVEGNLIRDMVALRVEACNAVLQELKEIVPDEKFDDIAKSVMSLGVANLALHVENLWREEK